MTTITIRDESTSGQITEQFTIEIPDETLTIRELIRSRVYQRVKELNARAASQKQEFGNQIELSETETTLNGVRNRKSRSIAWQTQFEKATAAFESSQILVFIDNRQATSLDQEVTIKSQTDVCFLRLTMLMGG